MSSGPKASRAAHPSLHSSAPEDPHALAFDGPSQLLGDAGLADARLAGKNDHAAMTGKGIIQGCRKLDHFTMAANEDTA